MAQVVVEMSGDEAKLFKSFQRVIGQAKKLETGLQKTGRAGASAGQKLGEAGKKGEKAFGTSAVQKLTSFASKMGLIQKITQGVTAALDNAAAAREKFGEQSRAAFAGIGSLAQLAETPKQMLALTDEARQYYGGGATETLGEAGDLIFALHSAGVGARERPMFANMQARGLVRSPIEMAQAAQAMRTAMGTEETGSYRAMVSKAFGVSRIAPATAEKILPAAAVSGPFAKRLGFRDEEVMAATAMISKVLGPERAGTHLAQMMRSMSEKEGEFKGKTLAESMRYVEGKGLSGEALKKFWGRSQGQTAYMLMLQNMDLYKQAVGYADEAQAGDTVGQKLEFFRADPELRAVAARRLAEGGRDMAPWARRAAVYRNLNAGKRARMNRDSGGGLLGGFTDWWSGRMEWAIGDEAYYNMTTDAGDAGLNERAAMGRGITPGVTPGISRGLAETLQRLDSTISKLDATVRSQGGGRTLGKPGNN